MNIEKHTPGPWSVKVWTNGRQSISDDLGLEVAEVWPRYYKNRNANAALIAAAPELLEALKAHQKANTASEMHAAYFLSRAAIAKAEGR